MTNRNDSCNQTSVPAKLTQSPSTIEMCLAESLGTTRVLVADDDPLTSQMLAVIAKKEGYEIISVHDGRDAYRLLKADADFKAAIININMPSLRGLDILRHMKTEKRLMRIPVLVVSGESGLKQMADSFAAGATMFLAKPLPQDQLLRSLRITLASREPKRQIRHAA